MVGGGPAGVAAAIACAREGAEVMLAERYGFLGGAATSSMVTPTGTVFCGDTQVIKGVFQEIVDRLIAQGGSPGHLKSSRTNRGWGGYLTPFDPALLQCVEQEMVIEAGVRLHLHSALCDVRSTGGKIEELTFRDKSGLAVVEPGVVIDATGNADVAARGGFGFSKGRTSDSRLQPMTLMQRIGGVETDALRTFVMANPEDFAWYDFLTVERKLPPEYETNLVMASGFINEIREERDAGRLHFGRSRFLGVSGIWKGELYLNATRVNGVDGTLSEDLTTAEMEGRKQAHSLFEFLKRRIPGFTRSYLIETGSHIGVRETRRVTGEYTLTEEDIISGRRFPDAIAQTAYPIDVHTVEDEWGEVEQAESRWIELTKPFDIPYRCLVPKGSVNLLVAGRCISVTHEALGSVRIQPTAFANRPGSRHRGGPGGRCRCPRGLGRSSRCRQGSCGPARRGALKIPASGMKGTGFMQKTFDVIVVGGGPAGLVSALAAARHGKSVLLIERYGFVGGSATMPMPILGFLTSRGERVVGGIPQEFVDRLVAMDGSLGHFTHPVLQSFTPVDSEKLKILADQMLGGSRGQDAVARAGGDCRDEGRQDLSHRRRDE